MTPDQLQAAYRAIHLRRQAIEAEDMALEGLERALDAYVRAVGYDLAAIVAPVIESPAPSLTPADRPGAVEAPRVTVDPLPATEGQRNQVFSRVSVIEQPEEHAIETHLCPRCDRAFGSKHAVDVYVGRKHQTPPVPLPGDGERRRSAPKPNGAPAPAPDAPGLIPGLGQ